MQPQQRSQCDVQHQWQQHQQTCKRWQQITADLKALLQLLGFDIVHAFPVQLFNNQSPQDHQLPTFNQPNSTLAIIIGNSNALWLPFLQQLAQQPQLQGLPDPLDAYVVQHITAAVQQCCCCTALPGSSAAALPAGSPAAASDSAADKPHDSSSYQQLPLHQLQQQQEQQQPAALRHELRFSHHTGPKFINMLRAAQLSGLAYYSSTTHLAMHRCYGPWFALRAVAVFDCEGPDPADSAFGQMTCPYPELEQQAGEAMRELEGLGGLANWQAHWRQWAELRSIGGKYTDPRWVWCYDTSVVVWVWRIGRRIGGSGLSCGA
jgi:methylmalonic aciduria homocystinuria type C protein